MEDAAEVRVQKGHHGDGDHHRGRGAAEGALEGRDIVLSAEGVPAPTAVRYLHSSPWFGSLYNEMGLPLGAFHADLPTAGR